MTQRIPWTREELDGLLPRLEREMDDLEAGQDGQVKPLPPMLPEECLEYFSRLMDAAGQRPLSGDECFLHGQLLSVYRQACWAEARGYKGRCFVIPESALQQMIDRGES